MGAYYLQVVTYTIRLSDKVTNDCQQVCYHGNVLPWQCVAMVQLVTYVHKIDLVAKYVVTPSLLKG